MDMQELDYLITQIKPGEKVLEIGCSNGFITEYIHDHTSTNILGIDFSDVAIEQARLRNKEKADTLKFECINLLEEPLPSGDFDLILLIDSIYFLGDLQKTLLMLKEKLSENGRMILSIFQYKEEDDPEQILLPDHTFLAQALNKLEFTYSWFDFTKNARDHGRKNYEVAKDLKDAFHDEGNAFLYEAREAENGFFHEAAELGTITRFMYVVKEKH
jgi:SAM-dependent methyltransferase